MLTDRTSTHLLSTQRMWIHLPEALPYVQLLVCFALYWVVRYLSWDACRIFCYFSSHGGGSSAFWVRKALRNLQELIFVFDIPPSLCPFDVARVKYDIFNEDEGVLVGCIKPDLLQHISLTDLATDVRKMLSCALQEPRCDERGREQPRRGVEYRYLTEFQSHEPEVHWLLMCMYFCVPIFSLYSCSLRKTVSIW